MKHELRLKAGERWDVSATGQYIGYVSGAGEIEIEIDGEPHYLDVNEVYQSNDQFRKFTVRNATDATGDFVIKTGLGKLYMAGDGQLTEVLGIRETVKTQTLNPEDIYNPIVEKLGALMGSVFNIREITETLKTQITNVIDIRQITETLKTQITNVVDIRQITETLKTQITGVVDIRKITETLSTEEKPASTLVASQKTFTAGESFTIPANENRRDITIMASEENTGVVTVSGIPLNSGEYITFNKFIGAVLCNAVAADNILITEVIK